MVILGVSLPGMTALLAGIGVPGGRASMGKPPHIFNVPKFTGFFFEMAQRRRATCSARP
jgi:hypothetical protein